MKPWSHPCRSCGSSLVLFHVIVCYIPLVIREVRMRWIGDFCSLLLLFLLLLLPCLLLPVILFTIIITTDDDEIWGLRLPGSVMVSGADGELSG
jgi:hypothetical protein